MGKARAWIVYGILAAVLGGSAWQMFTFKGAGAVRAKGEKASVEQGRRFGFVDPDKFDSQIAESYKAMLSRAREKGALDNDAFEAAFAKSVSDRILKQAQALYPATKDWPWETHVVDSEEVNAFCMPGGRIVVYTGLLREFGYDQDYVAAVLGHEVSHAVLEHSRGTMSAGLVLESFSLLASKSLKMGESRQRSASEELSRSLMAPLSRKHEAEADLLGLELMRRAGFEAKKAPELWALFEKSENSDSGAMAAMRKRLAKYESDHPVHKERQAALAKALPSIMKIQPDEAQGRWAYADNEDVQGTVFWLMDLLDGRELVERKAWMPTARNYMRLTGSSLEDAMSAVDKALKRSSKTFRAGSFEDMLASLWVDLIANDPEVMEGAKALHRWRQTLPQASEPEDYEKRFELTWGEPKRSCAMAAQYAEAKDKKEAAYQGCLAFKKPVLELLSSGVFYVFTQKELMSAVERAAGPEGLSGKLTEYWKGEDWKKWEPGRKRALDIGSAADEEVARKLPGHVPFSDWQRMAQKAQALESARGEQNAGGQTK